MIIETEAEKSKRIADNMAAIRQTIDAYYKVVASPEFKQLERMRQEARANEAEPCQRS